MFELGHFSNIKLVYRSSLYALDVMKTLLCKHFVWKLLTIL